MCSGTNVVRERVCVFGCEHNLFELKHDGATARDSLGAAVASEHQVRASIRGGVLNFAHRTLHCVLFFPASTHMLDMHT